MSPGAVAALVALAAVALASAVIGSIGLRMTRSTSDFLVASRTVGTVANAGAISGEYVSAASFLGVAGLILQHGADALWYPVGFSAGYLALVLFVAAPLRRSGAYTVPDFAEARLGSALLRHVCTAFVLVIGWLYVLPQLQGAGLTVATLTGLPAWTGELASGVIIVGTVALGGMRAVTFVQAFQYWLKLTAVLVPAVVAVLFFLGQDRGLDRPLPPEFRGDTTVDITTDVRLDVVAPVTVVATGTVDGVERFGEALRWEPGPHTVEEGAELGFAAGSPVPVVAGAVADDASWLLPFPDDDPPAGNVLATYSLLLATFLGTMGLPHVLVRFYTNPDGRAARRTAVAVLALTGGFYVAVTLLGALSRLYVPQLLVSGDTDAAVLLLPQAVLGSGWAGIVLGGLVAAGAWAAFLSTASGLLVSVAGVLVTDVLRGTRVRNLRVATLLAGAVPLGLALGVDRLDFTEAVALVFAVAASTFCPLLVLGIWWRGLTDHGAVAGVVAGGVLSTGAVVVSLAGYGGEGALGVLLLRPAIVSVPVAFAVMVLVSLRTADRRPADADQVLLRLHAPERLGLSRDRPVPRTGEVG
jgi:Na+(H+)/acetate symporter ActP